VAHDFVELYKIEIFPKKMSCGAPSPGASRAPLTHRVQNALHQKRRHPQVDVHTLLRLPTGDFYAQGVKANVLFFDRKEASKTPWTERLWIYDLRTNRHFTLKTNPLRPEDLREFVDCYNPENRHERKETERFRSFSYDELMQRDKANLDIFWLKDDSLEDSENLPEPEVLALEIVENLQSALEQFLSITEELEEKEGPAVG